MIIETTKIPLDPKRAEMWEKEKKMSDKQRRERYNCKKYTTLDDILPWPQYFEKNIKFNTNVPNKKNKNIKPNLTKDMSKLYAQRKVDRSRNDKINEKVAIWQGDITTLEIDAVVNAANTRCVGGGGIDGAIHRAAGKALYNECVLLDGCETGQSKITRGYKLPAKYVIHTVGPVSEREDKLKSCYQTTLKIVEEYGIKTIAFCGISTGIYGYPLIPACHVALGTIRDWLEIPENLENIDTIILCTYLKEEKNCYEQLMQKYFPVEDPPSRDEVMKDLKSFSVTLQKDPPPPELQSLLKVNPKSVLGGKKQEKLMGKKDDKKKDDKDDEEKNDKLMGKKDDKKKDDKGEDDNDKKADNDRDDKEKDDKEMKGML